MYPVRFPEVELVGGGEVRAVGSDSDYFYGGFPAEPGLTDYSFIGILGAAFIAGEALGIMLRSMAGQRQ